MVSGKLLFATMTTVMIALLLMLWGGTFWGSLGLAYLSGQAVLVLLIVRLAMRPEDDRWSPLSQVGTAGSAAFGPAE
jgi:hypothetical protein